MGGENEYGFALADKDAGSSPRGRGKPRRRPRNRRRLGLIPAWAGKTRSTSGRATSSRAHPRVGGENVAVVCIASPCWGSSPRGRGKRDVVPPGGAHEGLIPAWAGKTVSGQVTDHGDRAHPRVGGENRTAALLNTTGTGSSPRGRGKHPLGVTFRAHDGLIPAWAGKTPSTGACRGRWRAHPRVGGENTVTRHFHSTRHGSSPRGRGKLCLALCFRFRCGLIPAWAGKTAACTRRRGGIRAHPRVGGENLSAKDASGRPLGSSPRGRGKRSRSGSNLAWQGLIPAWAGKTTPRLPPARRVWAHPRVGGENALLKNGAYTGNGSSPRGRGKLAGTGALTEDLGLIPAWAGKTARSPWAHPARQAHPRVGGENSVDDPHSRMCFGSSPRGRGKPTSVLGARLRVGLIPAWAGKTGRLK